MSYSDVFVPGFARRKLTMLAVICWRVQRRCLLPAAMALTHMSYHRIHQRSLLSTHLMVLSFRNHGVCKLASL